MSLWEKGKVAPAAPVSKGQGRGAAAPRGSSASVSVLNLDERLLNLSLINVDDDV